MRAKRLIAVLLAIITFALPLRALAAGELDFDLEASAMALVEQSTGTVLASLNADLKLPMASTTKIMTALVVIENCGLDELVEIDERAVGVEGSSVYLEMGERMTVRDLLYGLMLASGNDAAVALACHAAGGTEEFARMMNERARRMGLVSTNFVTVNGLSAEGHYTTARELCTIARAALEEPVFREMVSAKYYTAQSGSHVRTFKNKNSLLWDYEGALGVKTGYTMAAGRCFVFAAERESMTVVGALLNCRPMFEKAKLLLDHAFANYRLCTVIAAGSPAGTANIKNGASGVLSAEVKDSIIAVMRRDEQADFTVSVIMDELTAPIEKGQVVGTVTVYRGGEPVGTSPLIAAESVKERSFAFWFRLLAGALS